MNQRHPGSSQDLPDLLGAISASAEDEAGFSTLSDDVMIASVQRRATALRVRRARTRNLVAAASVAAVGASALGVAQYVGHVNSATPASQSPSASFPTCGAPVSAPTPGALHLATATGASTAAEIPRMVIVNDSDEDLAVDSTGWVSYALVNGGVVVGMTTESPTPLRQDLLAAGETSEPLESAGATMCDGSPIPEGEPFEVYAYLDAETEPDTPELRASSSVDWGDGAPVTLWSDPITVHAQGHG